MRQRRLRWFGHVKRGEGSVLGEVGEVRVGSRRLRKKWSDCVMEDINLLGLEERMTQDGQMWRAVIACPTLS